MTPLPNKVETDIQDEVVMRYNEKRLHSYLGYASPNDKNENTNSQRKSLNWVGNNYLATSTRFQDSREKSGAPINALTQIRGMTGSRLKRT